MALPPPLPPQSSTSPTPLLYQGRVRGPPVSASIYVTDLPEACTEARLFELFNAAGPVASIRVCCDPATSRRLGSAYVNFHSPADAARAIDKLNYSVINGHAISIRYSASPSVQKIASARLLHRSCIALCCTAHMLHCVAPLICCTVLHRSYPALCCTAHILHCSRRAHFDPDLRPGSGSGCGVIVKNLDPRIDSKTLRDTFSQFGAVDAAQISVSSSPVGCCWALLVVTFVCSLNEYCCCSALLVVAADMTD